MTIYLKIPQQEAVPVRLSSAEFGNNGYLHIDAGELILRLGGDRAEMARRLKEIAELLEPRPVQRANIAAADWSWLTPQAVIEYFEQSPDLAAIAPDVRAVLDRIAIPGETPASESQLDRDLAIVQNAIDDIALFDEAGQTVHGAQTRVGEALGIPNEGGYRKRILAVLDELQKSTTSNASEQRNAPQSGRAAA